MHEKYGKNEMSTAELVYKFFDFYVNTFTTDQMINIKEGGFTEKLSKADTVAFSIVDPFQIEHNPGQSMRANSISYKSIISKFEDFCENLRSCKFVFNK